MLTIQCQIRFMTITHPPDTTTRTIPSALEIHAVAATCTAAIDKLLALASGGASGDLRASSAALLAADVAHTLEAEQIRLLGR